MADPRYGSGGGGLDDLIARAQAAKAAEEELDRKIEQRKNTEERATTTEQQSARSKQTVADTTGRLTQALDQSLSALNAETSAINLNTEAWRRNAEARAITEGAVLTTYSGTGRLRAPSGASAASADIAPAVGHDPAAGVRYQEAIAAQAAAEQRYNATRASYASAVRPTSTASADESSSLLAAREEAKQQLTIAKAETAAAQRSVQAQEQLAALQQQQVAEQAQINAAMQAERLAAERAAAEQAAAAAARAAPLEQAATRLRASALAPSLSPGASGYLATSASVPHGRSLSPGAASYLAASGPLSSQGGGSLALADSERAAGEQESNLSARQAEHARNVETLAAKEREATAAVNQTAAAYANSSQVLSRHGALTTEFIQAFARGQVTLQEFESQMVSTIGKFGGWAVAGGLVYGAYEAVKQLGRGATETQAAVQQLGRFIPGLGGPAGGVGGVPGDKSQIEPAMNTVRDISTQFNVPIKEVVDSMSVMARTFHTVADAGNATRAVLAVQRLDQVPAPQAEQYLGGISRSFNLTQGSQLIGVVNSLNSLQSQFGARVSDTLPALARAAPAAAAAGLGHGELEALVALGVRSGISGPQVGTALLRSLGTFSTRPASQQTFNDYGIQGQPGNAGDLYAQVFRKIDSAQQDGKPLSGTDLRNLAQALGGPLLGSRTILPMLEQEQLHPGAYGQALGLANNPRPYQEDLGAVLGTVGERFKAIGIALENFGSRLAQIGAFTPITGALDAITSFTHIVEGMLNPLTEFLGVINQIPGPVRDVLGVLTLVAASRALYNTTFGSTAQGFIGKLPGLSAVDSEPRAAIRGTLGRLETYQLPRARTAEEQSDQRLLAAQEDHQAALARQRDFAQANAGAATAPEGTAARVAFDDKAAQLAAETEAAASRVTQAEQRAAAAGERLAQLTADIAVLRDRHYSTDQKIAYMKDRELVQEQELVSINDQVLAAARARMEGYSVGAGAAGAAGAGAAGPAAAAAASAAAAAGGEAAATAGTESLGYFAALAARTGPLSEKLAGPASGADSLVAGIRGASAASFLNGPGALAALFGTTIVGNAVGGGVGSYINNVGGSAATGMFLGSMLGKGGIAAPLLGAAFGTVAGSFQQGTGTGLASTLGGAAGAGVGAAFGGLPGAAIGGFVGSQVGAIAGSLFGGNNDSKNPQQLQNQAQRDAQKAIQDGMSNQSGLDKFGNQFAADLSNAFTGTGDTASKAQAKIKAEIDNLNAELQVFGQNSAQGENAKKELASVLQGALSEASTNPSSAAQLISAASQQRNQAIQDQFKYNLSMAGPGQGQGVAAGTMAQYQQMYNETYGQLVSGANDQVAGAQRAVSNAQAGHADVGGMKQIAASAQTAAESAMQKFGADSPQFEAAMNSAKAAKDALTAAQSGDASGTLKAAQKFLTQAKDQQAAARNVAAIGNQANVLAQQAVAQAAYQTDQQSLAAQGGLSVAEAGADPHAQLHAQLRQQQQQLDLTQNAKGLDPTTRANDIAKNRAALIDTQNKIVAQGLPDIVSQNTLAAARIPQTDSVGQAEQKLKGLEDQYKYMKDHAKAFDPNSVRDAYAAVIAAKLSLADTVSQYDTTMNDIKTRIAQAESVGNAVAQAAEGVQGATRDLQLARSPQQRATAQLNLIDARNQQHTAAMDAINAQSQLTQAQEVGDNLAQAQTAIQAARTLLDNARGATEATAAQKALADANNQYHQALVQRMADQSAVAVAANPNDARFAARQQQGVAQYDLSIARGPDEANQARAALLQANNALHQADEQHTAAVAGLSEARAGSGTVRAAQIARDAAATAVRTAVGTDEQITAETNLASAEERLTQARISRIAALAQLSETQSTGNAVLQAQEAGRAANRELAAARTPDQRTSAEQAQAAARAQLHQATQARTSAYGQLQVALDPGDPVGEARIAVQTAQAVLRGAHGMDERIAAQTQLAQAEQQYHQALQQRILSLGALAQAQAQGNAVAVAQAQLAAAASELAGAKGIDEETQAQAAYLNAEMALHQALQARTAALGQLTASQTRDPLAQLAAQISATAEALSHAQGADEKTSLQTQLNNLSNQYESQLISQREATIQFQLTMRQITAQQAIAQLRDLENTQNLTTQERQQVEQQIRQLQLGNGNSEFNLAPGKIKLPTVYDIRQAIAGTGPLPTGGIIASSTVGQINVYVNSSADVPAVADALDRATSGQLAARLRAAGVIG